MQMPNVVSVGQISSLPTWRIIIKKQASLHDLVVLLVLTDSFSLLLLPFSSFHNLVPTCLYLMSDDVQPMVAGELAPFYFFNQCLGFVYWVCLAVFEQKYTFSLVRGMYRLSYPETVPAISHQYRSRVLIVCYLFLFESQKLPIRAFFLKVYNAA